MSEDKIQNGADLARHEVAFILKNEDIAPIERAAQAAGLSIDKNDKPLTKVKLAYPIKKNQYAFLGDFVFSGEPEKLDKFTAELKLAGDVLRYLITRFSQSAAPARPQRIPALRSRFLGRPKKPRAGPVLTNEAIEKKIEEILK